jgi:hypothetical protein
MARVRITMAAALVMGGVAVTIGAATAASASPPALAVAQLTSAPAHISHENRALGSVSCLGASFCMGVGNSGDQAAGPFEATFSQLWNGKTWQTTPVPSAPDTDDSLNGISCDTTTNCVAVGSTNDRAEFSDSWNGKTWTLLPEPAGLKNPSALSGVDCPASSYCIAVGSSNSAPLAQLWNGSSWHRLASAKAPAGATTSELTGISCTAPDNCLAVGHTNVTQDFKQFNYGLAESWNGHTWTILPTPPTAVSGFSSVSCPTASVCVAVGGQPVFTPVSAVWNGASWTLLSVPATELELLAGISCTSATSCMATGSRTDVLQWSGGSSWQRMSNLPDLPGYDFSSVSCPGPANCMVVGSGGGGISIYSSLAMTWNGASWRVLRTGKVDQLSGVSCPSVSDCLIVGADLDQADVTRTLAQTWNGKSLRLDSPHGLNGILGPVSCPTTTFCMASENSYLPGGTEMIATWDGKHWTWRPSPEPDFIGTITCASKDFCAAGSGGEIWNGKNWREEPFAQVTGEDVSSGISGVSCTRPGFCMAVGGWVQEPETGQTVTGMLAEVWKDSQWTIINPPSTAQGGLGVVSCLSPTNCTATGGIAGAPGFIAAHWNGSGWKISNLPAKITNTNWSGPSSISCPTATSCLAVGSYVPDGPTSKPVDVAFAWNGRTWRRTKVPGPGGIGTVSCAAANQCVAIGAPDVTGLAKVWNGKTWRVLHTINP